MSAANNQQAIREALAEIVNDHSTKFNNMGRVELLDRILSAIAPLLSPTPPVSTSAEKCAREIDAELGHAAFNRREPVRPQELSAIISRHFNGQGEDSARLKQLTRICRNILAFGFNGGDCYSAHEACENGDELRSLIAAIDAK